MVLKGRVVVHISADGKEYKQAVRWYLKQVRPPHFGLSRLAIDITFNPPDSRERDLDNLLKSLIDSLSDEMESKKDAARRGPTAQREVAFRGMWCNDSQIDEYRIRRGPPVKDGRVLMTITELTPVAQQMELAA